LSCTPTLPSLRCFADETANGAGRHMHVLDGLALLVILRTSITCPRGFRLPNRLVAGPDQSARAFLAIPVLSSFLGSRTGLANGASRRSCFVRVLVCCFLRRRSCLRGALVSPRWHRRPVVVRIPQFAMLPRAQTFPAFLRRLGALLLTGRRCNDRGPATNRDGSPDPAMALTSNPLHLALYSILRSASARQGGGGGGDPSWLRDSEDELRPRTIVQFALAIVLVRRANRWHCVAVASMGPEPFECVARSSPDLP